MSDPCQFHPFAFDCESAFDEHLSRLRPEWAWPLMTGDKVRFRFRKGGPLRLISHLDTMRCFERMLRRASIPFRRTQGFHPFPRLVLAQSLPLGVTGECEVGELELTEPWDCHDVQHQINAVAPDGLELYQPKIVPFNATAIVRRVIYSLTIPEDRRDAIQKQAETVLSQDEVWVERIKPRPRGLNIRPYLRSITLRHNHLDFDLWVTGGGTARADELVSLMDLDDLWPTGGSELSRSLVEIRDESGAWPGEPPIDRPSETRKPMAKTIALRTQTDETPAEPMWGLSPAGPVVE
jgi:radical SAM-linked protein